MPYYPPPASGGSGYNLVQDEGGALTARTTIDFVGAGVTATDTGSKTQVSISGGGGGASATTIEVDLGSTLVTAGKFTITDAAIGTSSKVLVWQAPGPYTSKGTLADEADMDRIFCVAVPAAGSATVYWRTGAPIDVSDVPDAGSNPHTSGNATSNTVRAIEATRYGRLLGRVRGNFKFTYVVFS